MYFARRKRKSLREEVLSSKTMQNVHKNKLEIDNKVADTELALQNVCLSEKEKASYLSSPHSVKGSFLRNKLDNPLFLRHSLLSRTLSGKLSRAGKSKLKNVQIVEASKRVEDEEDDEDDDDKTVESDTDDEDETTAQDDTPSSKSTTGSTRSRILNLTLNRNNLKKAKSIKKVQTTPKRRLNFSERLPKTGFLSRMAKSSKSATTDVERKKALKKLNQSSLSSNDSVVNSDSNISLAETEPEVDVLTQYEKRSNDVKNKENTYLLYSESGSPVEVSFNVDYLRMNNKICLYQDLASWTHDRKCLRLMYVKNRDTPQQERAEIKLYVADKEYGGKTTPADLNDLLQQRIAVLVSESHHCSVEDALELTRKTATERDVRKVAEQIDLSSERCVAEGYIRDI